MSNDNAAHGSPIPRPHPEVVAQRMDDEIVLVHLGTNHIYSLNQTGARAWELLAEGKGREAIEDTMLSEFAVSPSELSTEIDDLLAMLKSEGLVEA